MNESKGLKLVRRDDYEAWFLTGAEMPELLRQAANLLEEYKDFWLGHLVTRSDEFGAVVIMYGIWLEQDVRHAEEPMEDVKRAEGPMEDDDRWVRNWIRKELTTPLPLSEVSDPHLLTGDGVEKPSVVRERLFAEMDLLRQGAS